MCALVQPPQDSLHSIMETSGFSSRTSTFSNQWFPQTLNKVQPELRTKVSPTRLPPSNEPTEEQRATKAAKCPCPGAKGAAGRWGPCVAPPRQPRLGQRGWVRGESYQLFMPGRQRHSTKPPKQDETRLPLHPHQDQTHVPSLYPWVPLPASICGSPYLGHPQSHPPFVSPGASARWDEPPPRRVSREPKPISCTHSPWEQMTSQAQPRTCTERWVFSFHGCVWGLLLLPLVLFRIQASQCRRAQHSGTNK